MTDKELMQQVLDDICGARLCEINSMSSHREMFRLMDKAITALRERLEQPEQEKFSCGVDFADGLLTVSVVCGHADGSMEVIHTEQIALAQEPVATPSRSFEDVYKVQTERLATERERADKAEQNYRLMIKNHVPRNIFDWNRRK